MIPYFSISPSTGKRTGIKGYDIGEDYITVYFTSGSIYTYSVASCGADQISTLKALAAAQSGLNSYLTKNKPNPASISK